MWKIAFIFAIISVPCRGQNASGSGSGSGAVNIVLSCDHPLRVLQPELFTHCSTCFYGTWSEWRRIGHSISASHCNSTYAFKVQRTRTDNYGNCNEESQQLYKCKLTKTRCLTFYTCTYVQVNQPPKRKQ